MKEFVNCVISHFDIVSFDIFDTLIERNVAKPSDIFKVVGENVLGDGYSKKFCDQRICAEKLVRGKRGGNEVTLEEIYKELASIYREQWKILMKAEIETEIDYCYPKEKYVHILEKCIQKGKKVFLISDMYLSEDVIVALLNKYHIVGYDKLYVSNIYNANKRSGRLFEVVVNENDINVKRMVHIGDSIRSDFLGAHKAGIRAILIGRKYRFRRML